MAADKCRRPHEKHRNIRTLSARVPDDRQQLPPRLAIYMTTIPKTLLSSGSAYLLRGLGLPI